MGRAGQGTPGERTRVEPVFKHAERSSGSDARAEHCSINVSMSVLCIVSMYIQRVVLVAAYSSSSSTLIDIINEHHLLHREVSKFKIFTDSW
jgi:hypothetical protein